MKDYQTAKERVVLPKDVYMQTIWKIRGYYRMKENMDAAIDEQPDPRQPHVKGGTPGSQTEAKAMKREHDRDLVTAIDRALDSIPKEYRRGVWQKVMYNAPYPDDAHVSTYSKYKGEFVIRAAKYMGMI